jgi:hypothetical protein
VFFVVAVVIVVTAAMVRQETSHGSRVIMDTISNNSPFGHHHNVGLLWKSITTIES